MRVLRFFEGSTGRKRPPVHEKSQVMKVKNNFVKAVRRPFVVSAIAVGVVAATTVGNASTADWQREAETAYSEAVPYQAIVIATQSAGQVNASGPSCTDIPVPAGRSVTITSIRTTLHASSATLPYVTLRSIVNGDYGHYPINLEIAEDWSGVEKLYSEPMNLTLHIGHTEVGYDARAQICIAHTGAVSNATVAAHVSGYMQPERISFHSVQ